MRSFSSGRSPGPQLRSPRSRPDSRPHSCLLALVLLFLLNGLASGQTLRCSLNIADLPPASELVGFQLGMTREQVKLRIPQVVFGKTDDFGVTKTTINPFFDPQIDKASFEGVRSISLEFLDNRLTSLWIGYDANFKVSSVEEFIKRITPALHLPDAWVAWRSRGQQMRCAGFQLTVTMVADGPSFRIADSSAEAVVAQRRQAKEEEASALSNGTEEITEIVGDKKNKIYYPTGCHAATEIAAENRLVFKSAEAADKAGFKPAKNCE